MPDILDVLRKHKASGECIAEVKSMLSEHPYSVKINTTEVARVGIVKLKEYMRKHAANKLSAELLPLLQEVEIKDKDKEEILEITYKITVVR